MKKKLSIAVCLSILSFSVATAHLEDRPEVNAQTYTKNMAPYKEPVYDYEVLKKTYKDVTKDEKVMEALELMKGTIGNYSRDAVLGYNLTNKKIRIEFKNLSEINAKYASFDALGWKKSGRLYIYLNQKHQDAPSEALAALLSHEALHQDELDSLNEETYAWTMEAAVWTQLSEKNAKIEDYAHPLVYRENMLKKLFIKGDYSSKYIKKAVYANPGYKNLPSRSPGFEDYDIEDL